VAEVLELMDEPTPVVLHLVAVVEVVSPEVLVVGFVVSISQTITRRVWPMAKMALFLPFLPKRRANRRYWTAR
jgi:hypothetical protein